ncbi:Ig-like domain-containing protein [Aliiglaciecola sp. CAU 1673]|uniref:Ig-like domain-containing protein n=1 Tax=Aliiglaciecola sp. CAU 1673 TaxID=3032595 RepID=UPI0023DAC02E|nr:Ig-like domain-containing protein [Aliiglaciecola sp. CAU 1673]MDF2179774.1 Ig-like domain-containing protein [Aliiglaciecola sp. CAU 1673]
MNKPLFIVALTLVLSGCFDGDDSAAPAPPPPTNTAPVAMDASVTTQSEQSISGTLQAIDADNDTLTFTLLQPPQFGAVTLNASGNYSYTPGLEFTGEDSFSFSVTDRRSQPVSATLVIVVEALPVLFSELSRSAFSQDANAAPLRLNGRAIDDDVTQPGAYDDLLVD